MVKRFIHCPAVTTTIVGKTVYRPAIANAVDNHGGHWKACWQDSELLPTVFVVTVTSRRTPIDPDDSAMWPDVNAVAGITNLGAYLAQARANAIVLIGPGEARRIWDQFMPGE